MILLNIPATLTLLLSTAEQPHRYTSQIRLTDTPHRYASQIRLTDTPQTLLTLNDIHRFSNMSITNIALEDPFASLSINGQRPPNVPFTFNPIHFVHQEPTSIATQGPTSVEHLTLEQLTDNTYMIILFLDTSSVRDIQRGHRRFTRDIERMINNIPHITELNVVVDLEPIHLNLIKTCENVTDLFWTTMNASLFCRNTLIKYTALMEQATYIANNGDEVRALLEDLTFMVN